MLEGTLHAFKDRGELAVRQTEKACQLSPLDPFRYFYESLSASAYLAQGEYKKALQLAESSLLLNDRHTSTLRAKMVALHNLDRGDELRAAGRQLLLLAPDTTADGYLRNHPAADYEFGRRGAAALRAAGIS